MTDFTAMAALGQMSNKLVQNTHFSEFTFLENSFSREIQLWHREMTQRIRTQAAVLPETGQLSVFGSLFRLLWTLHACSIQTHILANTHTHRHNNDCKLL